MNAVNADGRYENKRMWCNANQICETAANAKWWGFCFPGLPRGGTGGGFEVACGCFGAGESKRRGGTGGGARACAVAEGKLR